jgi:hypothetical protein
MRDPQILTTTTGAGTVRRHDHGAARMAEPWTLAESLRLRAEDPREWRVAPLLRKAADRLESLERENAEIRVVLGRTTRPTK